MFGTNTYLTDVVSVITSILDVFMSEPVVYFVMLGLVTAGIKLVKKLSKR